MVANTSVSDILAGDGPIRAGGTGAWRLRTPEETLRFAQPLLQNAGITRIAVATGLDVIGIPVVMVTRPASLGLSVTQGKGTTLSAAKASGVMEALEHYHAETIESPLRFASEAELEDDGVLRPATLDSCRAGESATKRRLWLQGQSLASGERIWVPFDAVHLDLTPNGPGFASPFVVGSNGLASGNSPLEAACHGLLEVVERHLTAEFYDLGVDEQEERRIDLDSVDDDTCTGLLQKLNRGGVHSAVWDLSTALGIPCFMCEIVDLEEDPFRALPAARGIGCHGDRGTALSRAVCEAAQSRLTLISGARDDILDLRPDLEMNLVAEAHKRRRSYQHRRAERDYTQTPTRTFGTLAELLDWTLSRVSAGGFYAPVVVDLSKPELPFGVVRVLVPRMRGLSSANGRDS